MSQTLRDARKYEETRKSNVVTIYLQLTCLFVSFLIPNKKRPYHCLGCSLEGFTAFHRISFPIRFVTVALSRILKHS